jgi:UDP-2,4-diacetamido-2,4,6-trideoxy-beta-L-altropyranose hydrolase
VTHDAGATLAAAAAEGAAALVVDSYTTTIPLRAARAAGIRLLVVLEDDGRPVDADVVVSPGLTRAAGRLCGPPYALLAPEFELAPSRRWSPVVERALVVLGGSPPASSLAALAAAARRALPHARIDVVVGPGAEAVAALERPAADLGLTLHAARRGVRELMVAADVAVSAGGVTLLELAACATPTVGVALARNQAPNIASLCAAGAAVSGGDAASAATPGGVEHVLRALAGDAVRRRALGEAARQLVDGGGARRVSEALRARLVPAAAGALARC